MSHYILKFNKGITFRKFLDKILSQRKNSGHIYVRLEDEEWSICYQNGTITWVSDPVLDRIDDYLVVSGQVINKFLNRVDYHIEVKRN